MKKLVIASNNPGKLREIKELLAPLNIEIVPQSRSEERRVGKECRL